MSTKQGCDYLVMDVTNLLYRTFYAQQNEDEDVINGMASHVALTTMNKYFKAYQPNRMVMCFDRPSWRKLYTADKPHLKPYKGNRRQDMTPAKQAKYDRFMEHLAEFEKLITEHTKIITLAKDGLEADDLIAGFVQMNSDRLITIVTSDSDMAQLLKHENVTIISPATDKPHSLAKYDDDPEFYLFHKCLRGDPTDNIQSAYPRLQTKRIRKAFDDPFERTNLMKESWTDQNGVIHLVEDAFYENKRLIDLDYQPDDIRQLITQTIDDELSLNKKFSLFHIMKYLGKYKLDAITKMIDNYVPMLSR